MASLQELKLSHRLFVMGYPWRRINPTPWHPLSQPLSSCRLALVSTAGFVLPDQTPFDPKVRGGDATYREIPAQTDPALLADFHRSDAFDHRGIQSDPNLAFPLLPLRQLAEEGHIGSLNSRHLSFMGSITAPGRLMRDSAPEAARLLVSDQVDVALLVPV